MFRRATIAVILLVLFAGTAPCSAQAVGTKELPVIWVLSTGGTIAGKGASATDLSNYKSGSLLGEELRKESASSGLCRQTGRHLREGSGRGRIYASF
jgi:L-asparaginase/Glu-tRNA(Gln) amidotransferase subunit D